jgi:hypothetical protein
MEELACLFQRLNVVWILRQHIEVGAQSWDHRRSPLREC